jgi:hypothetical protein
LNVSNKSKVTSCGKAAVLYKWAVVLKKGVARSLYCKKNHIVLILDVAAVRFLREVLGFYFGYTQKAISYLNEVFKRTAFFIFYRN